MLNVQSAEQPVQQDWLQTIDPPRGQCANPPLPRRRRCRSDYQNDLFLEDWLAVSEDYAPEWSEQDILALREGVLLEAVKTATGLRKTKRRKDAQDWIADDSLHPFSFRVCCDAIPVDPDELRETLVEYAGRHSAGLVRQEQTTRDLIALEDNDDV